MDVSASESLGKYQLRGTLGRGAMGVVYDGWDAAIDRRVAIKTVRLAADRDEETREALGRFKREAQAAGRLVHPNIVGVYDYGETPECAYIVMEFVEGRSLKSLLDQETLLPPAEAEAIMAQVLAGLAYSHGRGVIHRDIKPANIMLTAEGQVKIADFGVARIESSTMTSVGTMIGTPAYMPPEQFLGEPADARSDIYAAGILLFHLLTGQRPYEGSLTSIMQKVLSPDPPPRASARAPMPAVFDSVVARAMAKSPAARFATATEFARALHDALLAAGREPDADVTMVAQPRKPASEPLKTPSRLSAPDETVAQARPLQTSGQASRASRAPLIVGGVAALVLVVSAAGFFLLRSEAPSPPPHADNAMDKPVIKTAPPSAAPVRTATAAEIRAAMQAALAALPCNALAVTDENGTLSISGPVGDAYAAAAQTATGAKAMGSRYIWAAQPVPPQYCTALEVLRSAPGAGAGQKPLSLAMGSEAGRAHLVFGSPIEPSVTAPDFPAWLSVDYLSKNGTVSHARFKGADQFATLAPGETRHLTAAQTGCLGPPYGTDLIVAIASSPNIRPEPRLAGEKTADYLVALRAALQAASDSGARVAVGTIVVDTSRGQPGPDTGTKRGVANPNSSLFAAPNLKSHAIKKLADCEALVITEDRGAWLKVTAGGKAGWLEAGHVTTE